MSLIDSSLNPPSRLHSKGQLSLPQACPICLHEPVKAEDCRPNKALRMTVRAFVKRLATEREKVQKKQLAEKAVTSPKPTKVEEPNDDQSHAHRTPSQNDVGKDASTIEGFRENPTVPQSAEDPDHQDSEVLPTEAQKDIPQPSIEVRLIILPI